MHKLQNCKQKKELQGNQIYLHNNETKEKEEHNISEKKIVYKVPENVRRQSIETLKVRKKTLDYLHQNGYKTIDDVVERQMEIPSEYRGNIYAYLFYWNIIMQYQEGRDKNCII